MDAESDAWKASALDGLRRYALLHNTFTMEAFRYEWMASGREPPHDHHVWGGLAHAARAAGIIVATGDLASLPAEAQDVANILSGDGYAVRLVLGPDATRSVGPTPHDRSPRGGDRIA